MTPAEFAREIVVPTVAEFRADPTSRRRAYLAAFTVYHLRDYLAEALAAEQVISRRGSAEQPFPEPAATAREVSAMVAVVDKAVRAALPSAEPFDTVQGVAIGSKHALTRRGQPIPFAAGSDYERPPAKAGRMRAGLSRCGDGTGGREIWHDGARLDLLSATTATLRAFLAAFPAQLDGVALDP